MGAVKSSLLILFLLFLQPLAAQEKSFDEVNMTSYALYEKGSWDELLNYGNEAIETGVDFVLLRLRMGYASFMKASYVKALKHYAVVLKQDSYNSTARYYSWLCYTYLNEPELASGHAKFMDAATLSSLRLKKVAITNVGFESSYKITDENRRGNHWYGRLDIVTRLGWNVHMQHSIASFNQEISEPTLVFVQKNNHISIRQVEYYNKTTINIAKRLQLKLAYHYLKTPFNNFSYNNQLALGGIKYYGNYFEAGAEVVAARITDVNRQQFNLRVGAFPFGNMNLYTYSTLMLSHYSGTHTNFKQVVGCRLMKKFWLEANGTFGAFSNLVENEGLYLYHAIDANKYKMGATLYYPATKNIRLQIGYTNEQRQLFNSPKIFTQHSLTGGLSWVL